MKEDNIRYINMVIGSIGFYLLFIFLFSKSIVDYDIWGYLSFGRIFWEQSYFPYKDVFSYTPTNNFWVYHEWLTGVILYPILKYFGPAGIQLFRYILIILTIYIIYKAAIKKSAAPIISFICISIGIILMSWGYSPVVRAQIFTYLFFALTIYIIEIAKKDGKWFLLLWIIPMQILWCNLHGGFVAGLGLIALYGVGEALSGKKYLPFVIIFFLASIATLINPYGVEYWHWILKATTMQRPDIIEWYSLFTSVKTNIFVFPSLIFIILSTFSLLVFAFNRKEYLTEFIIVLAVTYLGYKYIRHTVFMGIIFGIFMPGIFFKFSKTIKDRFGHSLDQMTWIISIGLALFYLTTNLFIPKSYYSGGFFPTFSISAYRTIYPVGALKWVEENNFSGNILSSFQWGQYLIWSTYPKCKVAMDGRCETIYPDNVQREYFDFHHGRDTWKIFLNKYPHDAVLVQAGTKIQLLMHGEPSWKIAYSDKLCVLFLRK